MFLSFILSDASGTPLYWKSLRVECAMLTAGGKEQQGRVLTDGEHEGHQGLGGDVAAVAVWDPLWYLCGLGE